MPAEAPLLLLRADAGPAIGSGHVSRLLALAEAWIEAGGRAKLFADSLSKAMSVRAGALGVAIAGPENILDDVEPGCWAAVDGYAFDAAYFRALRAKGAKVLAVEDGPRLKEYPVDLLLDQNAGAEHREYAVAEGGMALLGPRWALLRRSYFREQRFRRKHKIFLAPDRFGGAKDDLDARLLVSFGAADPADAGSLAIEALKRMKMPYQAVLVAGPDNPRADELARLSQGAPISVVKSTDLPKLMAESDLALLAGGVTMLEACVKGLPAAVMTVATNQEAGAAALAKTGAVKLLGRACDLTPESIAASLDALVDDHKAREALSAAGVHACDGRGSSRAAAVMIALLQPKLDADWVALRPALPTDALEVWRIANEPAVRANSFRSEPIPLSAHMDWYSDRVTRVSERFWVLDCAGAVAGSVRYAKDGDAAEVHYSVRSAFRGKGLGTMLLAATKDLAFRELGVRRVFGSVIVPNPASERSFASAGWKKTGEETLEGRRCAVFEARC